MFDIASDLLLAVDTNSLQVVAANQTALQSLSYSLDDITQLSITDIEASLQDVFYWDAVSTGIVQSIHHVEGQYRRADGQLIDVEKSIVPMPGHPRLLLICARDTSARQQTAQALEHYTSMLQATLEATADGILVTDTTGRIVNINHRFARMWQLGDDLLARQDDSEILDAMTEQVSQPDEYLARLVEITEDLHNESDDLIEFKDGRVFERHSMPQSIREHVVGRVFSFADITHRIQTEAALRVARDEAEQANRVKAEFLSQISHELRTPLNAIIGFSQMLADDLPATQRDTVQHITKAGWHLLELINEILDFAKLEAGKLSVTLESVDIQALINDCLMLIQPIAQRHRVTVHLEPSPAQLVRADPTRLKQMILNLLSNGCKYNRPHGKVTVQVTGNEKQTRIFIKDNGIGISETDLTKLFQAFTRVGKEQHKVEGTGIGLAFTQRLAQLMGGDVGVSSAEGVGSTFWIDLPTATQPTTPHLDNPPQAKSADHAHHTVLCVEDDRSSMLLLKSILQKHRPNLHLLTASSGLQALQQATAHTPDLLISDMNLPDMKGSEILAKLRTIPNLTTLPALALSADAQAGDISAGLAAGFNRYLTKPINFNSLVSEIDELLNKPNQ
nr:PAS domain-containing hybrid sensor histidine kinase/response regulator [Chitinivorax tropicus]